VIGVFQSQQRFLELGAQVRVGDAACGEAQLYTLLLENPSPLPEWKIVR